jgi:transcriptional regulator GlxA family with amidase domain
LVEPSIVESTLSEVGAEFGPSLHRVSTSTAPGASASRLLSDPVRRAMRLAIAEHHRPLKLSDLALSAAQTPFQLIRAFRRELGITPHALLVRVRVWRATARLMAGEPIASVATAVGFADQAHFTRHFKRIHGRTPARYRGAELKSRDAGDDRCGAGAR